MPLWILKKGQIRSKKRLEKARLTISLENAWIFPFFRLEISDDLFSVIRRVKFDIFFLPDKISDDLLKSFSLQNSQFLVHIHKIFDFFHVFVHFHLKKSIFMCKKSENRREQKKARSWPKKPRNLDYTEKT